MARYVRPRSLGTVFNNERFFEANISSNVNSVTSSSFATKKAKVESLKVSSSTTDSITLQDSLLQQNGDNLTISTDDGYVLYLNKDKPTSSDVVINQNSQNSNVIIENGTLFIRNGNLNVGNGSIMIDGALLDVVLRENQYQLSIQADNLANTTNKVQEQAVVIQDTVDVTVVNTSQIVSIQSNFAPLDQPIFSTNLQLPPIVKANNVNVTDVQVSYLSNLSGDVQSAINTLTTNVATVTSNQVTDRANISSLQTNLATVTSNQVTDKANIFTLQTNLATLTSNQVTDKANISTLQTNLATVTSKQVTDEANISSLQTNLATVTSNQVTDKANISTLQTNLATVTSNQVTDKASIVSMQTSLVIDEANISSLQTNLATVTAKQVTDEANLAYSIPLLNILLISS